MKYSVSFLYPGPDKNIREIAQFWNYGFAVAFKETHEEFYTKKHKVKIIIKDLLTQEEVIDESL